MFFFIGLFHCLALLFLTMQLTLMTFENTNKLLETKCCFDYLKTWHIAIIIIIVFTIIVVIISVIVIISLVVAFIEDQ